MLRRLLELTLLANVLLAIGGSNVTAVVVAQGKPIANVSTTFFDLGRMTSGEKRRIEIPIRNSGSSDLKIIAIDASCGCTTIERPKPVLTPGSSDIIRLEFNSAGMSGTVEKRAFIKTNDPTNPEITVSFKSFIEPVFKVVKYGTNIFLGTRNLGSSLEEEVLIENASSRPIMVKRIYSVSKGLEVRSTPGKVMPGAKLTVKIKTTPEKVGYVVGTFFIDSDHPISPTVSFKVTYNAK